MARPTLTPNGRGGYDCVRLSTRMVPMLFLACEGRIPQMDHLSPHQWSEERVAIAGENVASFMEVG
jgi:hypothetical protein